MPNVHFNYADVAPSNIKGKTLLKNFVAQIFNREGRQLGKIDYVFCSDKFLLNINRSFLNHDDFTDIITFDLSEGTAIIGEIYISIERVKENALIHNTTFKKEFSRVLFHGALHLCGYKDKKKSEITVMRQKEEDYLRLLEQK